MKVIHIIPRIVFLKNNIFIGGSVNALLNIIKSAERYIDSILYTQTNEDSANLINTTGNQKCKIYVDKNIMPPNSWGYGIYFIFKSLVTLIKNKVWNADLIHGHSGFTYYALVSVLLGKLLRKPVAYSLYCPIIITDHVWLKKCIVSKLHYYCMIFLDKILAMSSNVKKSLLEIGIPENKIDIFNTIIDTDKFNPKQYSSEIRKQTGANKDEVIILFVGNLNYSKGIDLLIDSLALIKDKHKFIFVFTLELKEKDYDIKLKKLLDKIENKGLSNCTIRYEIINFMPSLMASSDIIVIPYRDTDGPSDYPIALLEAMACAVPAIGTRVGGIPEIIEDNLTGILTKPEDSQDLANAISKLIENPVLRKIMGSNGRQKAYEMCNTNHICNILNVYKQLGRSMK